MQVLLDQWSFDSIAAENTVQGFALRYMIEQRSNFGRRCIILVLRRRLAVQYGFFIQRDVAYVG